MATSQHRCVFVGNIPYDATEEQLIQICEEVGPVVSFRLVIDRETGKPKGYGFCEYKDEETALSARRNLLGYEINGRQLRVDFAENDKGADRNREQGRGGPGMVANADTQKQPRGLGDSSLQPIGLPLAMAAASVMAGTLGGAQIGTNRSNQNRLQNQLGLGSDPLTLHLAKMSRNQLNEILSELKVMATQNRELARQLLLSNPQLSKALFQTEIMLGMVSPQMLQMPNISQAPSTLSQPLIQEGQQFKPSSIQTLPGVTPPTQSNLQFGLVPKVQSGQMPAVPQASPQQILQLGNQVLHTLPSNSMRPQLLGQFPVRPQTQLETSSSLKQQMQPPFPQQPTVQVGGTNLGHYNQMATSNAAGQPSAVHPPPFQEMAFKPSATSSGIPVTVKKEADGSTRVADDAIRVGRTNAYSSMIHDISEPMNRPPKLAKLDDGRSSSFSVGLPGPAASGQSQAFGISSLSGSQNSAPDEEQPSQNQLQLAPEVESALLQQVMNLTPEQLSSLPPEQRQQVMQLQQMLR